MDLVNNNILETYKQGMFFNLSNNVKDITHLSYQNQRDNPYTSSVMKEY